MSFLKKYLAVLVFLLLWEFLSRAAVVNPVFFPPLSEILQTIFRMLETGEMERHAGISLWRALSGFSLAVLVGAPLGLFLGSRPGSVRRIFDVPLELFSQLNPFLLFHILILFMGIGEAPKVTLVFFTCLWPVAFSSMSGAQSVNPLLVKSGRAFGLKGFALFRKIIFPAASPFIFLGLQMGIFYSLFMLIAAEMMGASSGLGFLSMNSQETFQLKKMYAAVLVIAFLGLLLDFLVSLLGKAFLPPVEGVLSRAEN
ncbi:MAG: ABC transporter permease [Deltaproteobacteria bacterium]|jgi:NitT/TauT family transport system permease protein|nr:ABC transporter permease [Deltaproteobacteria bacterium]